MSHGRNVVRTGVLVVLTMAILVAALLYLGAPGVFRPMHTYYVYFENASGIKPGADVMVAGRRVGQVKRIYSPTPERTRPDPKYQSLVEVEVSASAAIYRDAKAQLVMPSLLGDLMIDFIEGQESSGLTPNRGHFLGEKVPGLADAVPEVLEKLDPTLKKAGETLDSLRETADNLNRLTKQGADLPEAISEFRKFGLNLNELSGPEGPLRHSLENIETLTGPDSALRATFENAEKFTDSLVRNKDLEQTFRNTRQASERLNSTIKNVGPSLDTIGHNLEQASDTVKHQPWRLVWPTTKKYPEDQRGTPSKRSTNTASNRKP